MKNVVLIILFLLTCQAFAQTVVIKKIELAGEKLIVHYDLDDSNPGHEYQLNLFASKDNFAVPLTKVTGDVGIDIKPGVGKKIEWNLTQEIGSYKGRISLEIRGKVYLPIVRLQNFSVKKTYRRGKSYDLTWKPGNNNPINIELYKGTERVAGNVDQPNNGSYKLMVPNDAKKGKDYQLKISDAKNAEDVVYSEPFMVSTKIPLLVKLLPIAVVGGVVAMVAGKGGSKEPQKIENPSLPGGN